jgi:putative FmdB family regulatory protein
LLSYDPALRSDVMPTYDYLCNDCGRKFELVEDVNEHMDEHATSHRCPSCSSQKVERRVAEFFVKTSRKS